MSRLAACLLAMVLATPIPSRAVTWHVPSECATIEIGLDSACAGDTVLVACGTYHEHDIAMKSGLYLRSETGEPHCAVIDADSLGWVLYCDNVGSDTRIEGFTLTGGWDRYGGGMYCKDHSSPTIVNCAFSGNAAGYGGAVYCRNHSSPTFVDCLFFGNSAVCGGGLLCNYYYSSPTLTDCTFFGESADPGDVEIRRTSYSSPTYENSIISFAADGTPVRRDVSGSPVLTCCDVYSDEHGDWLGCLETQYGSGDDPASDPPSCVIDTTAQQTAAVSACSPSHPSLDPGVIGVDGVECEVTLIGEPETARPRTLYLGPAVADPFSPATEISYAIPAGPETTRVIVAVYDPHGERIRTLVDGDHAPGAYRVTWNRKDKRGSHIPSGVYFYRLSWNGKSETRRMVVQR